MDASERVRLEEIRDDINDLAVALVDIRQDVNALLDDQAPTDVTIEKTPWFRIAELERGTREIRGDEHNPRIVEYHSTTGLSADDDETPWCASFVNWCIEKAGLKGTDSARARSWVNWGRGISEPVHGCIVVLWRGTPNSRKGHVAFYVGAGSGETIRLLGGNQSNAVNIKAYPRNRVLGYRMPA